MDRAEERAREWAGDFYHFQPRGAGGSLVQLIRQAQAEARKPLVKALRKAVGVALYLDDCDSYFLNEWPKGRADLDAALLVLSEAEKWEQE